MLTSVLLGVVGVYILYLDESGNENDAKDRHFILAGAAVFERQTFFLSRQLDELQARHFPGIQPLEFHASHIRSGKDYWRNVPQEERELILGEIAGIIAASNQPGVLLFGAVIEKSDTLYGIEAIKLATEQLCKRFDIYLKRCDTDLHEPQRGLLVFAESRFHQNTRPWVKGFRELGTQWGVLRNLADIPYFASTKETRLLQVADFVSYSLFRAYEEHDPKLLAKIVNRFDQKDGVLHGLVHCKVSSGCKCPACTSRNVSGNFGPWVS